MDKKNIMKFANKDKMAIGICSDMSKKIGLKPVYVRGGLIAASVFINPFLGLGVYGAGYAYKKFKK